MTFGSFFFLFFFFNDTATTEIYTLSLHDALPISVSRLGGDGEGELFGAERPSPLGRDRSEEHTSELQSHSDLVCRLLLEKKKKKKNDRNGGSTFRSRILNRPHRDDPHSASTEPAA